MDKLEKMLKYVSEHNDFYKQRIKDYGIKDPLDITQWPVLTRKELQENRYNMFSDGYKSKYLCHQLIRTTSSGSSGSPVNVYWDVTDYYSAMMPLWRKRKEWYGILPKDKKVAFTLGHTHKKKEDHRFVYLETENELLINAASLSSEDAFCKTIKCIERFKPTWLYVQPFILDKIHYFSKRKGEIFPNSLIHIESVGEVLPEHLKNNALSFFNTSLANLYGSEENGGIAYECPFGNMHVICENVFLESMDSNAIITNLNNHAYPLIRYQQGDEIKLRSTLQYCKCGCNYPILDSIDGRIRQSFEVDGIIITTYLLSEIMDIVNNQFNGMILGYRFEYMVKKLELSCYITLQEEQSWSGIILKETMRALHKRLSTKNGMRIKAAIDKMCPAMKKSQILKILP